MAAGTATGIVIYTGSETRSVMNNSQPRSKVGLLDMEINGLTKVLFFFHYYSFHYSILIVFLLYLLYYVFLGSILCCAWFGFGDDDPERF